MKFFGISEAARELGVSESWLRRAEVQGRIPLATRDLNGWRRYSEQDIERLRSIFFPKMPVTLAGT